ncbi:MAG: hypothetical protein CVU61_03545 [Deltaproteobacteria bacterium HGW-Deltaproteobacteria-19]|jgi:acyl dehydratase|nr:MAG: hypothetical protein CVU61_03545 [Deltaproteobacteria bacterium HGW-Deltaproteobacteria-19]
MKLSSSFAGTPLREYETAVHWRDTMNYAAAVGDSNPLYLDDEREPGVIAPPMFAVALTWPISEHLYDYIEDKSFPAAVLQRQVHYREHLEFIRPVVPGDRLRIKGRLAAVTPHPAGTSLVIRYDALDTRGEPVFTEHITGLLRGVTCEGEGRGADALPPEVACTGEGVPFWSSRIAIDPLCPFVYDGCTRIHFPIHTSKKFAHRVGLPGIILQGTATLAFAVREITRREPAAEPSKIRAISCRFANMVFPGENIDVQLVGREEGGKATHLFFRVLTDSGKPALQDGRVTILP